VLHRELQWRCWVNHTFMKKNGARPRPNLPS